jgi:hypothetical protein
MLSNIIFIKSTLILSRHLCLRPFTDLLPLSTSTKILYAFLISPMRGASSTHLFLLDLIILIIICRRIKITEFLIMQFFKFLDTSSS